MVRKRGCIVNQEQLIKDNINLVYSVIRKDFPRFINDEDIIQCGKVGLCRAAKEWVEDKGSFSTFAWRCICNEINNEFRNRCKQIATLSLDYEVSGEDGDKTTFGDLLVGESDVSYVDIQDVYDHLEQREIDVFELKKAGMSTQEIADTTGYSLNVVRKCLRKVKRLLRN